MSDFCYAHNESHGLGWPCEGCAADANREALAAISGALMDARTIRISGLETYADGIRALTAERDELRMALEGLMSDAGRLLNCGLAISDLLAHAPGYASARGPWSGCACTQFTHTGSCTHVSLANSIELVRNGLAVARSVLKERP